MTLLAWACGIYGCQWRKCNIRVADTAAARSPDDFHARVEIFYMASRSRRSHAFHGVFLRARDREINRSKSETHAAHIRISFVDRFDLWKLVSTFFFLRRTNHAARCTQLESICVPDLLFNAAAVIGGTSALQCWGNVTVPSIVMLFNNKQTNFYFFRVFNGIDYLMKELKYFIYRAYLMCFDMHSEEFTLHNGKH